jgi:hypothetical protein
MNFVRRTCGAALPALALALSLSSARAQQEVLLNWDQEWSWMHPMGAIPPRPAGGADDDFATTWYLKESDFLTQYDGAPFGSVPPISGTQGLIETFDSGRGPGPVAYGDFQYTGAPLPAGTLAEFGGVASFLITPSSGSRHTGYFRTTFTVPDDGRAYQNPVLRYIMDDGGFVYLDGVPILRVNMASGVTDDYTQVTAGKVETESIVRNAQLYNPVTGPLTGGNNLNVPATVGNAQVILPVTLLTPGVHTLAISVHNESGTSSDIGLAVQLVADASACVIAATGTPAIRNLGPDAENLTDDTLDFDITVTGSGQLSAAGWVVSGPPGSSLIGLTGSYGVARQFSGVPISEFPPPGGLVLEVQDAATSTCKATFELQAPQRLGSVSVGVTPGLILNKVPWSPVWTIDEALGALTLYNSGVGADRVLESLPVNLAGVNGDVKFTAELNAVNTSIALEAADTFVAELLLNDGVNTTTVNLITPYDLDGSGRMNGGTTPATDEFNKDHLNTGNYDFTFPLSTIIPDNIVSATLVLRGVNDSGSETFIVKNVRMEAATHSIEIAPAGPAVLDHRGTPDPSDDQFSIPVNVIPASLPAGSLGWTSNATPASGLYSAANPVVFGPFPIVGSPHSLTLTDNPVTTVVSNTLSVSVTSLPSVTVTLVPNSITRIENGPGVADDTVSFQATIAGTNGGPGYTVSSDFGTAISPAEGVYSASPVTFTLSPAPPSGMIMVTFTDASYSGAATTLNIFVPVVYVIGTTNFGTESELFTAPGSTPALEWVIDSSLKTLSMDTGGTGDKIVESAVLDLSTIGAVNFSAKFRAYDSSVSSNFEDTDKFKAELIIDGTTVNLISAWDLGNGSFGSLGTNGAPDGYLNGYRGEGTTNDAVEADYNLYLDRDEFNRTAQIADFSIDHTFDLAYAIPAEANSVQLKIYGSGISGSEYFVVSDIVFAGATNDPDSDTDGIPDSIETAAGLNPADPADAVLDLDGDGQSNISEFRAGTTLTDPSSRLHVTGFSLSDASATVRWTSVTGKTYRLQSAATLAGPWVNFTGSFSGAPETTPGPDFGTQSATVTLPAPAATKYFLRVVIP